MPDNEDSRKVLERLFLLEEEELRRIEDRALYRFRPNKRQMEFANLTAEYMQKMISGGNQLGKTTICAAEVALHALGDYDEVPWYTGLRFSGDITIICASVKIKKTERIMAEKLFGKYVGFDENRKRKRLNGLIPKHRQVHLEYAPTPEVPGRLGRAIVKRKCGGITTFLFMAYSQDREDLQSDTAHLVWMDEEPEFPVFDELMARTNATHGPIILSMSPKKGRTKLIAMFNRETETRKRLKYGVQHADHMTDEEKRQLILRYDDNPLALPSLYGEEIAGLGLAYPRLRERALCKRFEIPPDWPRVIGYDIPHATGAGTTGHFAAVWIALDPMSAREKRDMTRYIYRSYKASGLSIHDYAAACKGPGRDGETIPGALPHDAGRAANNVGVNEGNAAKWRELYSDAGLNILPQAAGYITDDGHISRDPMIAIEENNIRINEGRLFIFDCPETEPLLREADEYFIDEDMRPAKKQDDHCCDGWTKGTFSIEFASTPAERSAWRSFSSKGWGDFDVITH